MRPLLIVLCVLIPAAGADREMLEADRALVQAVAKADKPALEKLLGSTASHNSPTIYISR